MFTYKKYLKNYKRQLIIGPLFKLLEAIFELAIPLVMAQIIDVGIINKDKDYIKKMVLLMVLLATLGFGCALICQYSASVASQGFGTDLRRSMFKHINNLSYKELDKLGTPSLINRITNDINQVQFALAMFIRLVTRAPFLIIGSIVMAIIISPKLSIIFIVASILIGLTLFLIMSKSVPFFTKIQKKLDRISLLARENLSGNRVIRAFAKRQDEKEKFKENTESLANVSKKTGRISSLLNPITYIITNIAIILIVWFGAKLVNKGNIMTGDVVALISYMTQILLAMIVLAQLVVYFTKAYTSSIRIKEVFNTIPSVKECAPLINNKTDSINENKLLNNNLSFTNTKTDIYSTNNTNLNKYKEETKAYSSLNNYNNPISSINKTSFISFKNVSFSYHSSKKELENISFNINKGETIGIIGGTGSGKTTLINLIPRFYDVTDGSILINNKNVKDYSFKNLRSKMGIVPQKSVLVSGTIKENIQWGKKNATDKEINKAIEIAQGKEFVDSLKQGINSYVAINGQNFSGGQKQRLTIARALVGMPEILVLDDSFSALDYLTDMTLRQELKNNTKNMTLIIASQRVSTIKNADKILFLHHGKLLGKGTHNHLIKTCKEYKEMCLSQFSSQEAESL